MSPDPITVSDVVATIRDDLERRDDYASALVTGYSNTITVKTQGGTTFLVVVLQP